MFQLIIFFIKKEANFEIMIRVRGEVRCFPWESNFRLAELWIIRVVTFVKVGEKGKVCSVEDMSMQSPWGKLEWERHVNCRKGASLQGEAGLGDKLYSDV